MAMIPRQSTRVSAGVYRNPSGQLVHSLGRPTPRPKARPGMIPQATPMPRPIAQPGSLPGVQATPKPMGQPGILPGAQATPRPMAPTTPNESGMIPKANPANKGNNLNKNDPRYSRYLQEYQNSATTDDRRAAIDKAWGFSRNPKTAYQAPAPGEAPPPTTAPPAPIETPAPNTTGPAVGQETTGDFRGIQDFLPKDFSGDPIYQFQHDQGLKDLNRLMAARGLTNSGAELEGNARFLNELGANTSQRYQDQASNDANRYDSYAIQEANRRYNQGNDQWGRIMDLLNYTQKNNPFDQSMSGLNSSAGLNMDQAKSMAAYLKAKYPKIYASGGGGGGGSLPPFVPPAPSGPDTSISDIMSIVGGNKSNSGYLGDILSLFTH